MSSDSSWLSALCSSCWACINPSPNFYPGASQARRIEKRAQDVHQNRVDILSTFLFGGQEWQAASIRFVEVGFPPPAIYWLVGLRTPSYESARRFLLIYQQRSLPQAEVNRCIHGKKVGARRSERQDLHRRCEHGNRAFSHLSAPHSSYNAVFPLPPGAKWLTVWSTGTRIIANLSKSTKSP